jgi:hypothetical protein
MRSLDLFQHLKSVSHSKCEANTGRRALAVSLMIVVSNLTRSEADMILPNSQKRNEAQDGLARSHYLKTPFRTMPPETVASKQDRCAAMDLNAKSYIRVEIYNRPVRHTAV